MNNRLGIYLEQEILSASPVQLVHLLYQAAISQTRDARRYMRENDIPARCAAISKACDLVGELRASLDPALGGEIASRLEALYNYILGRLIEANLQKSDGPLAEVLGLLITLDEAWGQIAQECVPASVPAARADHFAFTEAYESPVQSWSF